MKHKTVLLIISTICSDPAKNYITKFAVKEKWKQDITFIQGLSLNNEISCILREYMSQKNKIKYLILQLMFVLVMVIFLSLVTEKKKQTPKKRPPKKTTKKHADICFIMRKQYHHQRNKSAWRVSLLGKST